MRPKRYIRQDWRHDLYTSENFLSTLISFAIIGSFVVVITFIIIITSFLFDAYRLNQFSWEIIKYLLPITAFLWGFLVWAEFRPNFIRPKYKV